jgi:hypothetical protein
MELSASLYVLELYSGHGRSAQILSTFFGNCPIETVDYDAQSSATIIMDVTAWRNESHGETLRNKHPGRKPVIFASPPCEEYSRAKTTASRDLSHADHCVDMVRKIATDLDAAFVFVENPSTGLLPGRRVIESWTAESIEVCYCQYGFLYKKPTMIWVSAPLTGMQPEMCPGATKCRSCYYDHLHNTSKHLFNVLDAPYKDRIRVPDQLVLALAIAALPAIRKELTASREDRGSRVGTRVAAGEEFEVQEILGSSVCFIGGRYQLYVTVSWKNFDHTEELLVDQLTGPLSSYSFKTKGTEATALRNLDLVIEMNRGEDAERARAEALTKKKRKT